MHSPSKSNQRKFFCFYLFDFSTNFKINSIPFYRFYHAEHACWIINDFTSNRITVEPFIIRHSMGDEKNVGLANCRIIE